MRLQEIETRLAEIKAELEKEDADIDALEKEAQDLIAERKALLEKAEKRSKIISDITNGAGNAIPNVIIPKVDRQQISAIEDRANRLVKEGRMTIDAKETRSILTTAEGNGTLAKPTAVGGINDPFNTVSSIIDMVYVDDLTGLGSYMEAYTKSWQTADKGTDGTAPDPNDPGFRTVAINPFLIDTLTYVSKHLRRQTPLAYEDKVRKGALIALRKKVVKYIISGNGSTEPFGIYNAVNTEDVPESLTEELLVESTTIDQTTLRKIVFAYGGDENIGAGARLLLNKLDLIAFGDVRGTNEKKAVYEIIPDGNNPNTGIIKDGGLSVPYVICSDVTALSTATKGASKIPTMIYGAPGAYKLGLFGDYDIEVSKDYKFGEGLLSVKGEAMVGGNVIVDKGFVVVTLATN